jgi:hypothetical protein
MSNRLTSLAFTAYALVGDYTARVLVGQLSRLIG